VAGLVDRDKGGTVLVLQVDDLVEVDLEAAKTVYHYPKSPAYTRQDKYAAFIKFFVGLG
jgi:hypothetical protein